MPTETCPVATCGHKTNGYPAREAVEALSLDMRGVHPELFATAAPGAAQPTASTRTEKLSKPTLGMMGAFTDEESYGYFLQKWKDFKVLANINATNVNVHLRSCREVQSRMTQSLHILTSVAHSDLMDKSNIESGRRDQEKAAISSIQTASSMTWQSLQEGHATVWQSLWTSGFGISWSYAEEAVNGARINATMYYVLSQAPTPLHSTHTTQAEKSELHSYLSYTEGCYSGVFTLQASNLWTPLDTLNNVNTVVSFWLLTLEKNGCHNLIKAGADGVVQAMVLSLPGLKFSNQHLELAVHPKELHRDLVIRRLNYGNETHVNISVVVQDDNRAAIFVSLDKKNKDYFACDGGCLDAPVRLGPSPIMFPVKLTEPPTAILYITADHEHMIDLKHTIHVKEVGDAPAHEQHVLELHRHGARLGGLPAIFWVSIAFLILVFHLFLFRLIYNEYCAQPDKYRIRKYSDYN